MTSTALPVEARAGSALRSGLLKRELTDYPTSGKRYGYLGLTVLVTIALYYMAYCGGSVSTLQLVDLNMSFHFLIWVTAIGNVLGAFGALFAGITDRLGRVPVILVGITIVSLVTLFALPATHNRYVFAILSFIAGNIEGIVLVATPALIRDFSPQTGRATAMGAWTLGPVIGSLVVSIVGTVTVHGTPTPRFWGHEYVLAGIAGVVVSVLAIAFLRELAPGLRDQLMVSENDRVLAQMKAKGLDVEAALKNPFKQMAKKDVIISGFAVSILLLAYYTAIALGPILFQVAFGPTSFNLQQADSLGNWTWGASAVTAIVVGMLSDRLKVRKPFMVVGAVVTAVAIALYLGHFGQTTSYATVAILGSAIAVGLGVAYTPWMASFSETCEDHNPALTATGLAIWGLTIRVVIFFMLIVLPVVITTVTPLVNFVVKTNGYTNTILWEGSHLSLLAEASSPANKSDVTALVILEMTKPQQTSAALAGASDAATLTFEQANAGVFKWVASNKQLAQQVVANATELAAVPSVPAADQAYALANGTAVLKAEAEIPGQAKTWYWICFGGAIVFLGGVPLLKGRWSPRKAKADFDAHEAEVQAELAKLGALA